MIETTAVVVAAAEVAAAGWLLLLLSLLAALLADLDGEMLVTFGEAWAAIKGVVVVIWALSL